MKLNSAMVMYFLHNEHKLGILIVSVKQGKNIPQTVKIMVYPSYHVCLIWL